MYTEYTVRGNKDLDLLNSTMVELGYRSKLRSNVSMDIEGYYTRTENYTAMIQGATTMTPENYPVVATTAATIENIPLLVEQLGTSISLNIVLNKVQIKPFVTFQKTTLNDYSPYFSTSNAVPGANNEGDPVNHNVNSGKGTETKHKFTPKAYGGAYVNYAIHTKLNINLCTYWFSSQTFYQMDNITYKDGKHGVGDIAGKLIVNAKIQYKPIDGLSIFVNGKNLLNKSSVEYYRGDKTSLMVLGGVSFEF
jgi:iron complex outermembrane receptor protein